mgnify:CR=1 FL=1
MKAREFRDRLLVALYEAASAQNLSDFLDPHSIAENAGLKRKPGQLRLTLGGLHDNGLIELDQLLTGGDEGGMDVLLTAAGIEEAEELVDTLPPLPIEEATSTSVEYIGTKSVQAVVEDRLGDLAASIRGSNSLEEPDRQIALAEIAVFEASLLQPVIATDLIDRFVNMVLKWIASKFAEGAVSAVIAALILNLAPFLKT